MSELCDDDGLPIFTDDFTHTTKSFEDPISGEVAFDVIETNGNLWFNGSDTVKLMGFPPHHKGGYGRTLRRISPPDIIKIKDTPLRFTDGRRNSGSLISPRAVLQLHEGKTQSYNPIKAVQFVEWMNDTVLTGGLDAEAWSPARQEPATLEPVFRSVIKVVDENENGEPLDPRRPIGQYQSITDGVPIDRDEVEFCLCPHERDGLGKCWCGRRGGIRDHLLAPLYPINVVEDDAVIDDEDCHPAMPKQARPTIAPVMVPSEALLADAAADF